MSSPDSSKLWHCTVVSNCPFEQFSRSLEGHKKDYHSKYNSFPYKGRSETMHRRSDGKLDCPCGHANHRRFSYRKLHSLCSAAPHPPPETTKYSDSRPIDNALRLIKLPSLTPLPSIRYSRTSISPKALRASRSMRTKNKILNEDISSPSGYSLRRTRSSDSAIFLSSEESDDLETDDTPVASGSDSQESASHAPTDAQTHPGPFMPAHSKKPVQSHHILNLKSYTPQLQDRQSLSQPSTTGSSGITTGTRSPGAYVHLPHQPKNRTKEPRFRLEAAGPSTTLSYTSLVHGEGESTHGSHDQAPASGNPQGDQNRNAQSSGLPSSSIPLSLSETDALVRKVATLKRERDVLEEELARRKTEMMNYITTLEAGNLARRRELSTMEESRA